MTEGPLGALGLLDAGDHDGRTSSGNEQRDQGRSSDELSRVRIGKVDCLGEGNSGSRIAGSESAFDRGEGGSEHQGAANDERSFVDLGHDEIS